MPKDFKIPKSYVGMGEHTRFHIVSWDAYRDVFPSASRDDYQKVLTHELGHLFHVAYLKEKEEEMGPVWFYEGFPCLMADQFPNEPLPSKEDTAKILFSPEHSNYKPYVAIVRSLAEKRPIRELLDEAKEPKFNNKMLKVLFPRLML